MQDDWSMLTWLGALPTPLGSLAPDCNCAGGGGGVATKFCFSVPPCETWTKNYLNFKKKIEFLPSVHSKNKIKPKRAIGTQMQDANNKGGTHAWSNSR